MFQTRREKLVSRMQQDVDLAILVPGPNMHYFTGLHLKQSERLTFAVITAHNDLYFLLPQVELNKIDPSYGGVIFFLF
ncbi:aminopeptidase P family N-terminal domain-containing protein [Lysinibacillus sp. MHQ-1]|nr:aminopeptidase P family N-terminal domain-containing protein [Lysinibacillus sp. MHQ-1]